MEQDTASPSVVPAPTAPTVEQMLEQLLMFLNATQTRVSALEAAAQAPQPAAATYATALAGPELKDAPMETFKGGHSGLRRWLLAARSRIDSSRVPIYDPRALAWATGHLSGDAADWWLARVTTYGNHMGGYADFDAFSAGLLAYYADPCPEDRARDKICNLRQTSSVSAYAAAYTKLELELPNRDMGDRVHMFVRGLKPAIYQQVAQQRPATITDAIQFASIADRLHPLHRHDGASTSAAIPMEVDVNAIKTSSSDEYDPKKCHYCKKSGHWKKDCPLRLKSIRNGKRPVPAPKN